MFSHFYRNQTLETEDDGYMNQGTLTENGDLNDSCNSSMVHGFEDTHYHSVHSCSGDHDIGE